jgi:hypothetical protein
VPYGAIKLAVNSADRSSMSNKPLDLIKSILTSVAPSLATALGGPLAGMAVAKISQAITKKPDTPADQLAAAIQQSADPDILVKLKQADAEFAETMKKLDIDLEAIAEKDRESARARQIAVRDVTPAVLAYGIVGFFCVYAWLVVFHYRNLGVVEVGLASTVLGYTIGEVKTVYSYFFGSSSGSAAKTDIIAGQVATLSPKI